jgi:hypothetical protein
MANTPTASEFQAKLQRLETLIKQAERLTNVESRAQIREIVQALLDLHGTGINRLMELVAASSAGEEVVGACVTDDVVSGLLLLHDLHPLALEERVQQALGELNPFHTSQSGYIELLEVNDGVARVRFENISEINQSHAAVLMQAIEEAIFAKAPEVVAIEIDGLELALLENQNSRFALPVL